jgi:hypothetical protein
MLAASLLSIWTWRTKFHPKFGALKMTRRPPGGGAALALETAEPQARIRKALLMKRVKVVMTSSVARMMSSMSTTYQAVFEPKHNQLR